MAAALQEANAGLREQNAELQAENAELTRISAPVIRPLGSGELEAELASAPPGDGGGVGEAGVAEDG